MNKDIMDAEVRDTTQKLRLTIVVPCYNEAAVLLHTTERLLAVLHERIHRAFLHARASPCHLQSLLPFGQAVDAGVFGWDGVG